jgi:glutathione S-transferase
VSTAGQRLPQSEKRQTAGHADGEMLLIGRYLSPFVRRVAVTLQHFGIPYRRQVLSTLTDMSDIEKNNPVGRVPVLVLPSGESVIDSAAILDYLDQRVGPEQALMPASGPARQQAFASLMLAVGTIERAMTASGERRRPAEKQMPEKLDGLLRFVRQGRVTLDQHLGERPWFVGERMLQPDIEA